GAVKTREHHPTVDRGASQTREQLTSRLVNRATRTLGGAVNIAAFNVGIAVAPLASGLVINTGLGLAGTAWIGAAFAVAHVGSVLLDRHLTRRHEAGVTMPATASDPERVAAAS
ncbi:hypothetical protein AB0H07_44195, partial [Streptomyces sp. NPDC021354]